MGVVWRIYIWRVTLWLTKLSMEGLWGTGLGNLELKIVSVMIGIDCQLDRIWNHLKGKPLTLVEGVSRLG